MVISRIVLVLFHAFLYLNFQSSLAQSWVKAGYWYYGSQLSISDLNAGLFTHLICAFANVSSSSYELNVSSVNEPSFSAFTTIVKQENPSIITLLSIGGVRANSTVFSLMVSTTSSRKAFILSSIRMARLYGFHGLDLCWVTANTSSDMNNMALLFKEWRAAAKSEAKNSSNPELILTAVVNYSPCQGSYSTCWPVGSITSNLDWIHVMAYDYYTPTRTDFTAAHSALFEPSGKPSTENCISDWKSRGLSASKLVLGLPLYGYAWKLRNPKDNAIGAPAIGPAGTKDHGDISYKDIKAYYIQQYGVAVLYNATYVENYLSFGSTWIGYDDVESIKIKVSYARERKLRGYYLWEVAGDYNWILSLAAHHQQVENHRQRRWRLLVIILTTTVMPILLLGFVIYHLRRIFKSKGMVLAARCCSSKVIKDVAENFNGNTSDLQVFSFSDIDAATDRFSFNNKVGEGGYGPVYKGILIDGREIAVKKLSKTSSQGFEEFKNEVTLTARLQHVNLVQLLGFCIDREEQIVVYEYMPNRSLDFYLFDPIRRRLLDWRKRLGIIEGVTQGLLYLQEYSRFTIIHRDLKASNILLDHEMKPKISDFGMARTFTKDTQEANTSKIVGTYGYVPPEYVKKGSYSIKSDVYSFGVLLLQILSGKTIGSLYGENENLNLMEFAYELWKEGKGMEFFDPSLHDTSSPCKLMTCLHIALLCIQANAKDRPSMLEVFSMLRNESNCQDPKKPAFSRENDVEDAYTGVLQSEICSVSDATMSILLAR